jgi:1-acyl-sn-glycerol-3-phosphate acyltransferase
MPPLTAGGKLRAGSRLAAVAVFVAGLLIAFLALRVPERLAHGERRPWTPFLKRWGFAVTLAIMGLRLRLRGRPAGGLGAQVANHTGWMDVWVLNAASRVTFVSKAEVRSWPVLGWLAAISGTIFITRRRGDVAAQQAMLAARLEAGETLAFFPEGTSTDGRRVLPFKSTLFAVFLAPGLEEAAVQPVTLAYHAPPGERSDIYGWWGDMTFAPHLLRVLALPRRGLVEVVYHEPVAPRAAPERKALAQRCEEAVRDGLHQALGSGPAAPEPVTAAAR